jgi:hypothetical protein
MIQSKYRPVKFCLSQVTYAGGADLPQENLRFELDRSRGSARALHRELSKPVTANARVRGKSRRRGRYVSSVFFASGARDRRLMKLAAMVLRKRATIHFRRAPTNALVEVVLRIISSGGLGARPREQEVKDDGSPYYVRACAHPDPDLDRYRRRLHLDGDTIALRRDRTTAAE